MTTLSRIGSGVSRTGTAAGSAIASTGISPFADRTGRISWFGGPGDSTAGPTTASGASTGEPGIAVYDQSTLGGWWMIRMPNGHITVIKQTDIGPAPSTGRTFDFTYSALPLLGYSTSNFPTNATVRGIYLGKSLSNVAKMIHPAAIKLGADVKQMVSLISSVDVGSIERGQTISVAPGTGHINTHDPAGSGSGSEAIYSPILPDPGVTSAAGALNNFLGELTSGHFLLMILGGALLLVSLVEIGLSVRSKI